jgi:formylglycine-generating enzyme required for sulfatase activity
MQQTSPIDSRLRRHSSGRGVLRPSTQPRTFDLERDRTERISEFGESFPIWRHLIVNIHHPKGFHLNKRSCEMPQTAFPATNDFSEDRASRRSDRSHGSGRFILDPQSLTPKIQAVNATMPIRSILSNVIDMNSLKFHFAPVVTAILATTSALVSAATFTDRPQFVAANPGLEIINFEDLAPPGNIVLLQQPHRGMTFEGGRDFLSLNPNYVNVADRAHPWELGFSTPSDMAFVNITTGYVMRITLDQLYGAVGLLVNISLTDNVQGRVQAYSNGTLVGDMVVQTSNRFDTFVGFTDARGIDRIDISATSQTSGHFVMIDDLHFGNPVEDLSDVPIELEWMPVGYPGNRPDSNGLGAVPYNFRIAKHEITNALYAEFLNAKAKSDPHGLYNTNMGFDPRGGIVRTGTPGAYTYATIKNMANKPVSCTSFLDAARMANWMHNGQGDGSTETGAYDMSRAFPTRLPNAKYFIPNENEWHKAAYFDPRQGSGANRYYWLFPTRSHNDPTPAQTNGSGEISNPGANVANYGSGAFWNGLRGHLTTVGSAGRASESYFGTADQGGNVMEWIETLMESNNRGFRGGAWTLPVSYLRSDFRGYNGQTDENNLIGFRLAAAAPTVAITMMTSSVLEDGGEPLIARISRTGDTDEALQVNLSIAGTAKLGTDFTLAGDERVQLTIPAGEDEAILRIEPLPNRLAQLDRSVTLSVQTGNLYNVISPGTVTGTFRDDDFAPVANADAYKMVEDGVLVIAVADGILANDTDEDDGNGPANLTAEVAAGPTHGELVLHPDGSFSYTPGRDFFGVDSFSYRASDGTNWSQPTTVEIEVQELVEFLLEGSSNPALAGAPGKITHLLTLQNLGPSDASGVALKLDKMVPMGVTLDTAVPTLGVVVGDEWRLDLPEAGIAILRIEYSTSMATAGGVAALATSGTVTAVNQPLAETSGTSRRVETDLLGPASVAIEKTGATPSLKAQTGLFVQTISVTNHNPLAMAGFRLLITNLPAGVEVNNGHGLTADGVPYIDVNQPLASGAAITLSLEFHHPSRSTNFDPAYAISGVFASSPEQPATATDGAVPNRIERLANHDMLIEFATIPGRMYAIEYSDDMEVWQRVIPLVSATNNRTQWVDAGQPKTASHPSTKAARYYRIVPLTE